MIGINKVTGLWKSWKFQVPKYKSQTNINDRNSKFKTDRMTARYSITDWNVLVIGIFNFNSICNLSIVNWIFSALYQKASRFYLNQLELTLTFPWSSTNMAWLIFSNHTKFGIQTFKYNQNTSRVWEFFITKARKYENTKKIIIKFRAFPISCFRDCFYFFATKNTKFTIKKLT